MHLDRQTGRDVSLPTFAEGDVVAIHGSGAYGLITSPLCFISHPLPHEVLVEGDGLTGATWLAGRWGLPP